MNLHVLWHGRDGVRATAVVAGLLIALTTAACGGTTASHPTPATNTTLVTDQITVDGTVRTYHVLDPSPQDSRPKPLLLALHEGKSDGLAMVNVSQFDQVAEADGFIVAFPDGVQGHWNAGSCCGATAVSASDELAFFSQLLDRVSRDHRVDQSRVYVAGFSAGGFMAYRLACDLSTRITAVASVSGSMPDGPCTPQRPVSVLEIHGTADDQLPYTGGVAPGISDHSPSTLSIVTAWAQRDGCSAQPASSGSTSVQTMTWVGMQRRRGGRARYRCRRRSQLVLGEPSRTGRVAGRDRYRLEVPIAVPVELSPKRRAPSRLPGRSSRQVRIELLPVRVVIEIGGGLRICQLSLFRGRRPRAMGGDVAAQALAPDKRRECQVDRLRH